MCKKGQGAKEILLELIALTTIYQSKASYKKISPEVQAFYQEVKKRAEEAINADYDCNLR